MDKMLIVGASSAIGMEVMRQMDRKDLVFLAHYNQSCEGLVELAASLAGRMELLQADLAVEDEVRNLLRSMVDKDLIPNMILHLAAPKVESIRFKKSCWDDFRINLDIQLRSIVLILQEFLPVMARRRQGKVVVMLSSYTLNVPPMALAHYVSTKYALLGLVRALASEYRGKKININAVSPSMTETEFLSKLPDKLVELNAARHPYGRNCTPRDIAPVIRLLLTEDSDYMTGLNIPVSGGEVF